MPDRCVPLFPRIPLAFFILLYLLSVLEGDGALAIGYVESSEGLIPPTFEGGRTEVEFADVDDDGNLDLVSIGDHGSPYINTDQHGIMVWFGDGLGGWSVHMEGNFGYGGIAIGDLNSDGLWDAAYGMHHDYSSTDFGDQILEAALGDGTGRNWIPWDDGLASAGETWGMFGTDLADVDNDGDLDIGSASFGCCAGVHVYESNGDGTWAHRWGFLGGNCSMDFHFVDINADGFIDFAVAHDAGTVYLGDGHWNFTSADGNLPPGGGTGRSGLALGDIDNDGDLDIAYRGSSGNLEVWRYEAGALWSDASTGLPASGISAAQLVDMNQDGFCDLLALGSEVVRIWLGDGGASWNLAATIPLPSPATRSAIRAGGDVDHNGKPDIAVITEQGSWPSYRNVFHLFREDSEPVGLAVRFVRPHGGEALVGGSVQFIDWVSEVPGHESALVDLDLSATGPGGPWVPITAERANGGRHQWRVPVIPETHAAYLRIRLTVGKEVVEALTPMPFTILPPTAASVGETHDPRPLVARAFPNPSAGEIWFVLPGDWKTTPIQVFDLQGRLIRSLPGSASLWDGRDHENRLAPTGVYILRRGELTLRVLILR
jgi:hypothetical protein